MKIFSSQKKDKQNYGLIAKSTNMFFPPKKRVSQMVTISDFISFNNNQQKYISNLQSPQPIEKLNNFKKNYNKVQFNMQKDQRNLFKCKTAIKKRKINDFLNQKQCYVKNTLSSAQKQLKRKISVNTPVTHKINIPGSLLQIKNDKIYPRYKMLQLYSLYKSLLQYCERDPKKFLQAFEASLNYRRIIIKSEIVRKNLFHQKHFQFSDFVLMYKKMQDLMFIQNMIDYLQIIFQVCNGNRIKYQTVYEILLKRSQQKIAIFITNMIFKKLNISHQSTVSLQQIIELCQKDMEFCSAFSKLYHHFQHL